MESYHRYFDQSPGNSFVLEAPSFRDDVDVRKTGDLGGGFKVAGISTNEWLEYQIKVTQAGTYTLIARVASDDQDVPKRFQVIIDEDTTSQIGPLVVIPVYSAGWDAFVDIAIGDIELSAGTHIVRVVMNSGWFDLNYIDFKLVDSGGTTPIPLPTQIPFPGVGDSSFFLYLPTTSSP